MGEAGNIVARLHDEARAFKFVHGGDEIAKSLEESIPLGGIRQRDPNSARTINLDAQLAFFAAGVGKILRFPVFEFVNELDGVISGFGYFFETLRKREVAINGPEHHGKLEWRTVGVGRRVWQNGSGGSGGTAGSSRYGCAGADSHKFSAVHIRLPRFRCERFSRHTPRAPRRLLRQAGGLRSRC